MPRELTPRQHAIAKKCWKAGDMPLTIAEKLQVSLLSVNLWIDSHAGSFPIRSDRDYRYRESVKTEWLRRKAKKKAQLARANTSPALEPKTKKAPPAVRPPEKNPVDDIKKSLNEILVGTLTFSTVLKRIKARKSADAIAQEAGVRADVVDQIANILGVQLSS